MSAGPYGLRAARVLTEWLFDEPLCSEPDCRRRATRVKMKDCEPVRCDAHSDGMRFVDRPNAALIRESEALVSEANDRPSVRAFSTKDDD